MEGGRSANGTASTLSGTWLQFATTPTEKNRERLAATLNGKLKELLPAGSLGGRLIDAEPEVRQSALLLLATRFLKGNQLLLETTEIHAIATENGQSVIAAAAAGEVEEQIERSCRESLKIAFRRLRAEEASFALRHCQLDNEAEGAVMPEAVEKMSTKDQINLALIALATVVARRTVSPATAAMMAEMLLKGKSQAEVARELGVSRAAVCQRVKAATEAMHPIIEQMQPS